MSKQGVTERTQQHAVCRAIYRVQRRPVRMGKELRDPGARGCLEHRARKSQVARVEEGSARPGSTCCRPWTSSRTMLTLIRAFPSCVTRQVERSSSAQERAAQGCGRSGSSARQTAELPGNTVRPDSAEPRRRTGRYARVLPGPAAGGVELVRPLPPCRIAMKQPGRHHHQRAGGDPSRPAGAFEWVDELAGDEPAGGAMRRSSVTSETLRRGLPHRRCARSGRQPPDWPIRERQRG